MEYVIDRFIEEIVNDVQEQFEGFTYEQIYESAFDIIKELVDKKFLDVIN